MVDYTTALEVVWHGGMKNDPLGGHTKGCLIAPREQTEDERLRTLVLPAGELFDQDFTAADLERAVEKLNRSLKNPIKFGAFGRAQ